MKRDQVYLRHILDAINRIESYASVGRKEFMTTPHWQDAIIRNFEVIGEAAKCLREDFKKRTSEIPWRDIAGFRDVLIHEYMGVDLNADWKVIEKDLPGLKRVIQDNLED